MSIQDYRILTGAFNAYIARLSENGQRILEPRRVITEGEIMNLIAWWLDQKLSDEESDSFFIYKEDEPIIELKRLKNYDI